MLFRRGSTLVATLASAVIGIGALSAVGYSVLTGKTLCSVVHGCDSEKKAVATTVPASDTKTTEAKSCCALKAALASASTCTKSASSCCKSGAGVTAGVVALNAAYPIVVPASFYSEKSCCSSSFVKAASVTTVASSCCQGSKAAMLAASNGASTCTKTASASASGCCKSAQAATLAASNETATCTKTASASGCCKSAQAAMFAASNASGACTGAKAACCKSKNGVVAASTAYPVMIPAAFYSDVQVCPTTLVKAAACTGKAVSGCCSKGAAVIAASATTEAGCCKGSGARADGKACCGKCTKTQTADTTEVTPVAAKGAGTN